MMTHKLVYLRTRRLSCLHIQQTITTSSVIRKLLRNTCCQKCDPLIELLDASLPADIFFIFRRFLKFLVNYFLLPAGVKPIHIARGPPATAVACRRGPDAVETRAGRRRDASAGASRRGQDAVCPRFGRGF